MEKRRGKRRGKEMASGGGSAKIATEGGGMPSSLASADVYQVCWIDVLRLFPNF